MDSVETTDKRFEVGVPSTAIMDRFGVSAGTSVSIVVVVQADHSPSTLRVEALSPSSSPTTSVSLAASIKLSMMISNSIGPAQWVYAQTRLPGLR